MLEPPSRGDHRRAAARPGARRAGAGAARRSTALLQFTSGSTAAPKGVVLSHANLDANVAAITGPDGLAITPDDVGVSWLPLYHDMGLIGMLLTAVYMAADVVILSPVLFLKRPTRLARGDLAATAARSRSRRTLPTTCACAGSSRRRSRRSTCRAGASPAAAPNRSAPTRCRPSPTASRRPASGDRASCRATAWPSTRWRSRCRVDGLKVDVVDAARLVRESIADAGASTARRRSASSAAAAPFPGHDAHDRRRRLDDAAGTACRLDRGARPVGDGRLFRGSGRHRPKRCSDGWLHTGDLGYIANGELFVCGRTKDLIIRQGRKYHPPDLESAIADVDGIRSSGVVVFGINRIDEADEVVAVLEARASADAGRRRRQRAPPRPRNRRARARSGRGRRRPARFPARPAARCGARRRAPASRPARC